MNVLLVSEPGVNGVFRYVEALAAFLIEEGVTVHLAYSDIRGSDSLRELVARIEKNGGVTLNLNTPNAPALTDIAALRALRALVKQVKPDVIHSHSSKAGALARALRLLGVKTGQLYHPHAYAGMRPKRGGMDLVYDRIEQLLGRFHVTINCSRDEQSYAFFRLHLPPKRVLYVPNGVDTRHFTPLHPDAKRSLRQALGLPPDALILGALCRNAPQKDPVTLYRAFAKAREQRPDMLLFHVGCGELDGELDRVIATEGLQNHVIRRDSMDTPVDFYRAVDGFMLTSRYEGLSLAVLEALACDLPLILSRAPGNMEFAQLPLSHLWTARIGDVAGFAEAISRWSQTSLKGINHRLVARERFDNRSVFGRVLAIYESMRPAAARKTMAAA